MYVSSTISIDKSLKVDELGVVDYLTAWELQKQLQEKVANNQIENTLLMLQHTSVYTAGRRTQLADRPIDNTPVIDVDRGGKITWHGLGQIVGYPILRLKNSTDVVGFVRELETSLIQVCELFGVKADRYCERSGVWVRVAKGVTMHGFALNVNPDLSAYSKIIPCGIADAQVTSLAKELNRSITVDEVMPTLIKELAPVLERLSQ
jgi:lipoyl(octanoyl) transferase